MIFSIMEVFRDDKFNKLFFSIYIVEKYKYLSETKECWTPSRNKISTYLCIWRVNFYTIRGDKEAFVETWVLWGGNKGIESNLKEAQI